MREKINRMKSSSAALAALLLLVGFVIVYVPREPAEAQQEPSNEPAAMVARGDIAFAANNQTVEILREIVKTSKPTDLLLSVTAVASIITEVATTVNDNEFARGQLEVFVTLDGQVVTPPDSPAPPGPGNPPQGDTGPVVFANRLYQRQTTLFDDTDATIRTFMDTRHAAGFNWMALNVGSGTHLIQVFARYTQANSTQGTASGVIGNRSLIVQPVKAARDETITIN